MGKTNYKRYGKTISSWKKFSKEQKSAMENDINKVHDALKLGISEEACKNFLDEISWKYTETIDKFIGCKYWSEGALEELSKYIKICKTKTALCDKLKLGGCIHEHIIPRNIFIDSTINESKKGGLSSTNFKLIQELLECCIITKDEDKLLVKCKNKMCSQPNDFYKITDLFDRYRGKFHVYGIEWDIQLGTSGRILKYNILNKKIII